jgi:hypothetical protein
MISFGKIYEGKTYQYIWDNSASLYQELLGYKVLVFRGIETDYDAQVALMKHFYPSTDYVRRIERVDHQPLFDLFENKGLPIPGTEELFARWHTDDSWLEETVDINCIHMLKLNGDVTGGKTRWVDLEARTIRVIQPIELQQNLILIAH